MLPDHPGSHAAESSPPPADVPVYNCVIYLATETGGGLRARVANLPGIECEATSERAALLAIVAAFKQRLAELTASQTAIPWIDPPLPIAPGERTRLIGIHL